jgi:hypothetical protein
VNVKFDEALLVQVLELWEFYATMTALISKQIELPNYEDLSLLSTQHALSDIKDASLRVYSQLLVIYPIKCRVTYQSAPYLTRNLRTFASVGRFLDGTVSFQPFFLPLFCLVWFSW